MRTARSILIFVTSVVVLVPVIAYAQVVISEIMYDLQTGSDSGREWVEVFNSGGPSIHLVDWKVAEGGSNHVIVAFQGGEDIPSGAYAILADNPAKFLLDWPAYSGLLFDTAFTSGLSNTGETIAVGTLNNGTFAASDTISYQSSWGASGDGDTLKRDSVSVTSMSHGAPTPGTGSLELSSSGGSDTSDTQNDQSNTSVTTTAPTATNTQPAVSSASNFPVEPQIFAYAGKDRDAVAGADTIFEARATNKNGDLITPGRFLWTFGDGASAEGQTVMHHFAQPGRYVVVLDIADGLFVAPHQVIVTVLPVSISLSLQSGDIVLANKSGKSLDLSYWILRSGQKLFTLPKNTILLGGVSIPFVSEVTHLTAENDAALLYPNGSVAADMTRSQQTGTGSPAQKITEAAVPAKSSQVEETFDAASARSAPDEPAELSIPSSTAEVAAAASAFSGASYPWWLGAFAIAVVGGAVVATIRRTKKHEWDIIEESPE